MATSTVNERVAAEVRAALGRKRSSVRQMSTVLGKSQSYWARRVDGRLPLTFEELVMIADYCSVPVSSLITEFPSEVAS